MILTPKQMTEAEKYAVEQGISLWELMQNAGAGLAEAVKNYAYSNMKKNVLILCGKGNNGGDGFVCAKLLSESGMDVTVFNICGEPKSDLGTKAFKQLNEKISVIYDSALLENEIEKADIIIDAVFGTGFKGELTESVKEIFRLVNNSGAYKIACDIPSGINCLNGDVSEETVLFDETVTFHALKIGCMFKKAAKHCGKITVTDIKIPQNEEKYCDYFISEATSDFPAQILPERDPSGHKGTFGKLLCVCGSSQYKGAAALSVGAALRSGVGMVELFCEKEISNSLFSTLPEAIYTEIDKAKPEIAAEKILEKSQKASAILIGCGLSSCENSRILVEKIIEESRIPVILDADGINSISSNINVLLNAKAAVILTPHPGELARICGVSTKEISNDRLGFAVKAAKELGVVIMAKGAGTFVTDGKKVIFANCGNTALSKGGSGDILAGITGGFIAQGADFTDSCAAASIVLGKAAEFLAEGASQRCIIGSDILSALPYVFKKLGI